VVRSAAFAHLEQTTTDLVQLDLLAIARTIGRKGVNFHTNVELAFFAGEEQGLVGSRTYAEELKKWVLT
jgi:hypothetical protein